MKPAFSVIFLTTLIGTGQGLFLALYTGQLYSLFGLLPRQGAGFYAAGSALALGFLALGLFASFFHLGRPLRAWRSAAQWRTSWLSREVIALPALAGLVALYGLANFAGWQAPFFRLPGGYPVDATLLLGGLGTITCFALFLCTGMIYACLRFLQEWHTPLTVINYTLLGGASGFLAATAYAAVAAPGLVGFFGGWTVVITALAAAARVAALVRNARLRPKSNLATAIGVRHPRIVQKSAGFLGGSFNTREFFHGRSAALVRSVKWLFLVFAFPVPLALLAAGVVFASQTLLFSAFLMQYAGLIAERWFFFAQANHPQNLYYRAVS
ncbi:MAG: DmsC/YnfH family molybdoenzyme membrane anchor subunit [Burkholderiales bacterium]